ncbi:hypothetical protein [Gabonibacter massiliensis]|uniref:hypothetical protein n=1 Tax=Gabonibacter massiliensis TaxID=1720195 RepID=UPI002570214A|nr:hypothetical protein [Gabonibacter massiliensis]
MSPNNKPPASTSRPVRTVTISINTNMARARLRLFTFLHPPHAQMRRQIRLTSGTIINRKMPIYSPVEMGSSCRTVTGTAYTGCCGTGAACGGTVCAGGGAGGM